MSKAHDILREHESKNNGGLSHWQEEWILEAMYQYAKEKVNEFKLKAELQLNLAPENPNITQRALIDSAINLKNHAEEILKQITNE